jgi:oligoribonuclease
MTEALENSSGTLGKSDQNLVWIDCEMTGLDPDAERLIEIAVIVTGPHLTPRIEGPVLVIHQGDEQLNKMDAWNKGTHGKSGLIDKVKASSLTEGGRGADP